jgi:cysteine desulfurase
MNRRIYLDHAATTPVLPQARAAMAAGLMHWANPSSPHAEGRRARRALEDARTRIKRALDWTGELIFTSGASEALQIALDQPNRVKIVSAVEHDAVFRAAPEARVLAMRGALIDPDALSEALAESGPAIVALQHVNSETGIIQNVSDVAARVRAAGGILVSDCSQSAGKYPLPDADLIVVSAHKLGGPPGIGALLVRNLAHLRPSGGQEQGYRAGTQNLPAALGFAAASEAFPIALFPTRPAGPPIVRWLHDIEDAVLDFEGPLGRAGGGYQPAAPDASFAPHVAAITMPGMSAEAQVARFDMAGIAVSAGSACSSGTMKTSPALKAFGVDDVRAACTIRVSYGWNTTADDIAEFHKVWLELAAEAGRRAA